MFNVYTTCMSYVYYIYTHVYAFNKTYLVISMHILTYTTSSTKHYTIYYTSQINSIEGQRDLSAGRLTTDARNATTSEQSKHYKTIIYSPDGTCILAGGLSKYVCLYSAITGVLLKKFELSHNRLVRKLEWGFILVFYDVYVIYISYT